MTNRGKTKENTGKQRITKEQERKNNGKLKENNEKNNEKYMKSHQTQWTTKGK